MGDLYYMVWVALLERVSLKLASPDHGLDRPRISMDDIKYP